MKTQRKTSEKLKDLNLFAEVLSYYIQKKNLTQRYVAEEINVTPQAVTGWLNKSRHPESDCLTPLINVLKLSGEESEVLMLAWRINDNVRQILPAVEEEERQMESAATNFFMDEMLFHLERFRKKFSPASSLESFRNWFLVLLLLILVVNDISLS